MILASIFESFSNSLVTIGAFVLVLGILVFIHELGHFLVAKRVGIKVDKFSLGFPPNIVSYKRGETTYCIGVIPLGGYVKMAGENPDEAATGDPREFMSKSIGQRAAVIFAGPFMNYILAIFVFILMFAFSGRPLTSQTEVVVGEVTPGYPAEKAGMQAGDVIVALDGRTVSSFDTVLAIVSEKVHEEISLTWMRGADTMSAAVVTEAIPDPANPGDSLGRIGFSPLITGYERMPFFTAVGTGFTTANDVVVATIDLLAKLFTGRESINTIGGPVAIAQLSGQAVRRGGTFLFNLLAVLSVNLAVLNVLPIPVLDGGHLVFLAIEKLRGAPLSMKARMYAQQVGMIVLLTLIVFVTYNDILRIFTG